MVIGHPLAYEEESGAAATAAASSAVEVLDAVVEADAQVRRGEVAKLEAVLAWAHAHPAGPGAGAAAASWEPALLPGDGSEDGADLLGGPGTPAVAEFCVEQLATRLRVSTGSAMQLVADALDLAHRHPILWARVRGGECPVWLARRIAATCSPLPAEAAAWVDEQIGDHAGRCAAKAVESKLAYALAKWDPERTRKAEEQARDGRHLDIDLPGQGGNAADSASLAAATLRGRLSTTDALKFDALVAAKAAELAHHGDTTSLDIRRAKALGLIADQLLTGELDLDLTPADDQAGASRGGQAGSTHDEAAGNTGTTTNRAAALRKSCLPATLHLHVRVEDLLAHLAGHTALGTVEKLGPATLDLLAEWLGQTDLHIAPVLDAGRTDGVDSHDPPEWMRELVIDRDRHCAFPHCNRDARSCDLDHIVPYDPDGPPGQTRPDNLAPLCRRHHRCKTFTRWRYQRLDSGDYQWTDPHGTTHLAPL